MQRCCGLQLFEAKSNRKHAKIGVATDKVGGAEFKVGGAAAPPTV